MLKIISSVTSARSYFRTQGRAKETTDGGKEKITERLPQFTALLRRLSPKNTSPARNEVVYEEEAPC